MSSIVLCSIVEEQAERERERERWEGREKQNVTLPNDEEKKSAMQ
jgi:hypothetical protein